MSTEKRKKYGRDQYNRTFQMDVVIDVVNSPIGSIGVICGLHYKIEHGKAWRWNVSFDDWVLSTNSVQYVNNMINSKRAEYSSKN